MAFAVSSKSLGNCVSRKASSSRVRSVHVQATAWLPGSKRPAHLTGTLPGDFGFDPLGLGKDPETLRWYQLSEVIHCRAAMTAVAGIVIPGLLTKFGALNVPQWYEAGKVYNDSEGALPFSSLLLVSFALSHFAEVKRYRDFVSPKSQGEPGSFFGLESALAGSGDSSYPGGAFDPLGLAKGDATAVADWKLKEVKNGRFAMLAFMGFVAQYYATGKGPIDNLFDHLADPWHNNFAENGISLPFKV